MTENTFDLKIYNNNNLLKIIDKCIKNFNETNRIPPDIVKEKWLMYVDMYNNKWTSDYLEAGSSKFNM